MRVVCGSETISILNSTAHELVMDINMVSYQTILPQWTPAAYWASDKPVCDVTHFKLFDSDSTTESSGEILLLDGLNPTIAKIMVNGLTPQRTTFWLQGRSNGNKGAKVPIDITVCGLEELVPANDSFLQIINVFEPNGTGIVLPFQNMSDFFNYSVGASHPACSESTY